MEEATLGANRSGEKSGVFPPSSLVVHLEAPPQPPCLAPFVFSGFCQDVLKKYQRNVVATAARVCSSAERAQCVKAAKERVLWAPSG